jgi:hypothetical protein
LLTGLAPTSVAAQTPVSIFNSGAPPPVADSDTGSRTRCGFRSDVNRLSSAFGSTEHDQRGTHIGNLWTNGGLLATATFTAERRPAGNGDFPRTSAIAANTT